MTPGFWKNKKVFLTGHTGFKGSWASLILHQAGAHIFGYALAPNTQPNLHETAGIHALLAKNTFGDLRDQKKLLQALKESEADIVIHMAAQPLVRESYSSPMETFEVNAMGTAYLLEAVRQCSSVKAVVTITTDKVYENLENQRAYQETDALGGHDPYSASKACAEIVTASMRRSFFRNSGQFSHPAGIATVRAGNVIGGGDWSKDRLIPDLIRHFVENREVTLRSPDAVRPWQHVLEPLFAYFNLAEKLFENPEAYSESWNVGPEAEDALTVQNVAALIAQEWGPSARCSVQKETRLHEAHFLHLSIDKIQKQLSWKPRWKSQQALHLTADWYKKYYQNPILARELCLQQIHLYQS